MTRKKSESQPHSAEYFGRQRDFWWNPDYLELIARRCGLDRVSAGLDVGCGVGHWGRVLAPFLSPGATMVGVDRETTWVKSAGENAVKAGLAERFSYVVGNAMSLPFEDAAFDLVTCQTLLIHVPDRLTALREMLRVLKPGGRLLLVEPNNLASAAISLANDVTTPVDQALDGLRFQLICERGKYELGLGFNSAGEKIPGELAAIGVDGLEVFLSDKTFSLIPPYAHEAERAAIAQIESWSGREFWIWSREETERYFLAGGGTASEFERLWKQAMNGRNEFVERVRAREIDSAGGGVSYLITATKR